MNPQTCDCGKKCFIAKRYDDGQYMWVCTKCEVYSSNLCKRVKKHIRKLTEEEIEHRTESIKVRDHCHITGKYRGSAHQKCNRRFRLIDKIPVIFHNLRGYDSHFIMQEIGKFKQNINVIPNNMEEYMAFMLGNHLVFIDSFQFMSSSLERLVGNLPDELDIHLKSFKEINYNL